VGQAISVARLAAIFGELEAQGAENINLVTGTHYTPQIIEALQRARAGGLGLPVVWNTSAYEEVATIRTLADQVDIWLADFRHVSPARSARYCDAPDYPAVAAAALETMAASGGAIIIRFLLFPGQLADAKRAVEMAFSLCGNAATYSLMSQYTPMPALGQRYPELARTVSDEKYDELINFTLDLGVTSSFMQEGACASRRFIPEFDLTGVRHEPHSICA
jgi:putative pyruvate formate lyase activating enzyme